VDGGRTAFLAPDESEHDLGLLSATGLQYNENAIAVGAQTERRGLAWAGETSASRR
jgi:hypothetical protein